MQKVIYLGSPGQHVSYFNGGPDFRTVHQVPFLPDDLLLSGTWRNKELIGLAMGFRMLVPAIVFFKDGQILAKKREEGYRIWFGEPIRIEEITPQTTLHDLAIRTMHKELVSPEIPLEHIGYSTYRNGKVRNEFLVVYAANVKKKRKLKGEDWYHVSQIPEIYFKMDSLSKKIFDTFYEEPVLQQTWLVSKKQEKNS